jgi:hypothetical protein
MDGSPSLGDRTGSTMPGCRARLAASAREDPGGFRVQSGAVSRHTNRRGERGQAQRQQQAVAAPGACLPAAGRIPGRAVSPAAGWRTGFTCRV